MSQKGHRKKRVTVAELEQELAAMRGERDQHRREAEQCATRCAALMTERDTAVGKLNAMTEELATLRTERDSYLGALREKEAACARAESSAQGATDMAQGLHNALEISERARASNLERVRALELDHANLSRDYEDEKRRAETAEEEKRRLAREHDMMSAELVAVKADLVREREEGARASEAADVQEGVVEKLIQKLTASSAGIVVTGENATVTITTQDGELPIAR
jgi:chromosome segregation ATPase